MIKAAARRLLWSLPEPLKERIRRNLYENPPIPPDMESDFVATHDRCKDYTMTSVARMYALYKATEYVIASRIPGDVVECGVWRGGSAMICALALRDAGDTRRTLYLYDTYKGMSEPTDKDVSLWGEAAAHRWSETLTDDGSTWCYATVDEVRQNMLSTGYPGERIRLVEGRVEETLPGIAPERIALLRLDTDWYESTYHELVCLYPLLMPGGVLVIDDYGQWRGAREAVDQYFAENGITMLLSRIDYTGRMGIKPRM